MAAAFPKTTSPLLDAWRDASAELATGAAACWADLAAGRIVPLDSARWWMHASTRRPPRWSLPHEIVLETPIARLRDFSPERPVDVVPTLVLPPQAGHDSCIVDYSPEQSQMGVIVEAGLERALTLDWVGATAATAHASIDDYLGVVDGAVEHCGGRVNLIGDCQGGWLATIYAALEPERVNTLTIAGAPVDFHAGEPVVGEVVRLLAPGGDLRFYEQLVASNGGVMRGEDILSGFVLIQPGNEISRQVELLRNPDDPTHVERYREFEDWFKHTQDIPGAFYLWIVRRLFRDNALVDGSLEVGGRRVDLGRIAMPLNLLAGAADHITPPDQVFALADSASTPDHLVTRREADGGHLGLFMGHASLREHGPPLLAEVLGHSLSAPSSRRPSAAQRR
jgi:poly(3-hydroxyalkanoate) synthetase